MGTLHLCKYCTYTFCFHLSYRVLAIYFIMIVTYVGGDMATYQDTFIISLDVQ